MSTIAYFPPTIMHSFTHPYTDMLVAPLWDPSKCQFVGLLTVTDFIDVLLHYRNTQKNVESLATQSIADILQDSNVALRPFQAAEAECTLWQACKILLHSKNNNIHSRVSTATDFLPIVYTEDMRVLACITFTNILEHLVKHFREQRRLFDDTLADLGIGTYENLVTVAPSQTLADALERMQQHNLSAIPVVDDQGKIAGVYSRSDITFLTKATDADDAVRNLSLPLHELLAQARQDVTTPDALFTCSPTHTLQSIFESFADMHFHRLFVVDAEERLVGVVSARDLVQYLVPDDA